METTIKIARESRSDRIPASENKQDALRLRLRTGLRKRTRAACPMFATVSNDCLNRYPQRSTSAALLTSQQPLETQFNRCQKPTKQPATPRGGKIRNRRSTNSEFYQRVTLTLFWLPSLINAGVVNVQFSLPSVVESLHDLSLRFVPCFPGGFERRIGCWCQR